MSEKAPLVSVSYGTSVITTQPLGGGAKPSLRDWTSGLCNCFDDIPVCLCGLCCGPCMGFRAAADMDETPFIVCCVPLYLIPLRTKLRTQENIMGSIFEDCVAAVFCHPCTLCQVTREIKAQRKCAS